MSRIVQAFRRSKGKPSLIPMSRLLTFVCLCLALFHAQGQSMTRIFDKDTPAHRAARKFMRGINIGNSLEYASGNGAGGLTYTASDFAQIRAEGFDHVRIPIAWHLYTGPAPSFTIGSSIFTKVDAYVAGALARNLAVIINLHQFTAFTAKPSANQDQFYSIWRQVAEHYSNHPASVAFELFNEPNDLATTAVMNKTYPEAVRQIRLTNPDRTLFLGPGNYNGIDELKIGSGFTMPNGDNNLIATVHCYDPYYFTHQGAEWALPDTGTVGIFFPGPPATPVVAAKGINHSYVLDWIRGYNTKPLSQNPSSNMAFRDRLRALKKWSDYYGRPVHVGEFGCYEKADPTSRVNFYREIRAEMDSQSLGWAMWDWKAGFHYMKNGRPDPLEIREAMFPPIRLEVLASGTIEFDSAAGKTFVVQKSDSVDPNATWQDISTISLTTPRFSFSTPSSDESLGFYRVKWLKQ